MSEWRRTVCGDLTSIFRASTSDQPSELEFLKKDAFMESVYNAKFKKLPNGFKALGLADIRQFQKDPYASELMPNQEKGIKPSNGLTYQLYADGVLSPEKDAVEVRFESSSKTFGKSALGSAFNVYAPGKYLQAGSGSLEFKKVRTWAFAVKSSTQIEASWPLKNFENGIYHLRIYGPNGFFREFKGSADDPHLQIKCEYETVDGNKLSGNIELILNNQSNIPIRIEISDNAYKNSPVKKDLHPATNNSGNTIIPINLGKQFGWYDFTVRIVGSELFEKRYAGRVDTGEQGYSDPYMGRTI
jgi:phospholipase C